TPLCCCTAIPTATELYRATGRRGPACAFLIATPWFNWYGVIALAVFLGWSLAGAIALCGVLVGTATGLLVDLVAPADTVPETGTAAQTQTCGCSSCHEPASATEAQGWWDFSHPVDKLRQALRTALGLLRELAPWILAGAVLGALVKEFLPTHWVARYGTGADLAGLAAAVVIAGLIYTDSLGSLPWIHALRSKGLGAGNAMLLLIAGVGTNVATLGPVGQQMGRRTAVAYAVGVVAVALVLAVGLNHLLP
ncbi:MAG TPA: permease, partial [Gammaproteobacteria bacterium]|nr:permease [Gammaproteobacteria bacterium]